MNASPSSRTTHATTGLLTDLYELTMGCGYWKHGMTTHEAVFHVAFRTLPFQGGYAVAAGLGDIIHLLSNFRFSDDDLKYLATSAAATPPRMCSAEKCLAFRSKARTRIRG